MENGDGARKRREIVVYLPEGMADWEVGLLMSEIKGQELTDPGLELSVRTAGPTAEPVRSIGGLTVTPDLAVGELRVEDLDALVLCGGTSWYQDEHATGGPNEAALTLAAGMKREGRLVAAICGAVSALGGTGLLDDVEHTGNDLGELKAREDYAGEASFVGGYAVRGVSPVGGEVVTAASWAPVELAAEFFRALGLMPERRVEDWVRSWRDRDVDSLLRMYREVGEAGAEEPAERSG